AFAIFGGIVLLNRSGVRALGVYFAAGACMWVAMQQSGIHATLTGVALGLLAPASYFYDPKNFHAAAEALLERFDAALARESEDEQQAILAQIEDLSHGTEAPLERLERMLHPWVSFVIVP